jgi:hypothetical protein
MAERLVDGASWAESSRAPCIRGSDIAQTPLHALDLIRIQRSRFAMLHTLTVARTLM